MIFIRFKKGRYHLYKYFLVVTNHFKTVYTSIASGIVEGAVTIIGIEEPV